MQDQSSGLMGLPARLAIPIFIALAAVFLAITGYFVNAGLGNSAAPLGRTQPQLQGDARIAATAAPLPTDAPGTYAVPQTGTGPITPTNGDAAGNPGAIAPSSTGSGAAQSAAQLPGQQVGGGGPPAPVMAMLTEMRQRLESNPKDLAALVGLANLEFDAGKFDKAMPYYRRALALDPGNPDVRTDEATALHQMGHDLEALSELDIVIKQRPNFGPALYNRGVVLRAIGRRSDAIDDFNHFIKQFPSDPRVSDAKNNLQELGG